MDNVHKIIKKDIMNVIPVINCTDAACVEKTLELARSFLHAGDWVHLDVTDGIFSTHKTWNDPVAWSEMDDQFNLEVHLMVIHPEDYIVPWLDAGAKRIIIHIETITPESVRDILKICSGKGAEIMLASNPNSFFEKDIKQYADLFSEFLVLAVQPGPAGQPFDRSVLEKIKALKQENAIMIEVDGGMNPETVKLVKDAGADAISAGTYIFNSSDPKKAYEELKSI